MKMFRTLRDSWKAWSQDPLYYRIRRIQFGIMTPVSVVGTILLLVWGEWTGAAILGAAAIAGIVGAMRTPWRRDG